MFARSPAILLPGDRRWTRCLAYQVRFERKQPGEASTGRRTVSHPEANPLSPYPMTSETDSASTAYRVLARRYRPARFQDLIGQEAMVRTLTNAFAMNRIAHAFMLSGVRGVGKTTTARLLARALNYETPSRKAPGMDWEEEGIHCAAIMSGHHMDVMEMDAASHTGIGDIREIIDRLQYAPTSARYKVYIIDEVHMLSQAAFNGLLKTLEEPPAHVKFIFATTEIRKVPVTILSRCQRFDLRRLDMDDMSRLLLHVSRQEGVELSEAAMHMLSRAAGGSARDALSLLDQAIAHGVSGEGPQIIAEDTIGDMLGLADQMRICDLFDAVMEGKAAFALNLGRELYDVGAEPLTILSDMADLTHWLTRLHLAPEASDKIISAMPLGSQGEAWGRDRAKRLSLRNLHRVWQMLIKGIEETRISGKPVAAMEMLLARLACAADLPHLDEALEQLSSRRPSIPVAEASDPSVSESERLRMDALKLFPGSVLEGEEEVR